MGCEEKQEGLKHCLGGNSIRPGNIVIVTKFPYRIAPRKNASRRRQSGFSFNKLTGYLLAFLGFHAVLPEKPGFRILFFVTRCGEIW
jgi:hypothetical protein